MTYYGLKRNKAILTLLALIIFSVPLRSEEGRKAPVRDGTILRSGPGNYYPLVALLAESTEAVVIDSTAGWVKIVIAEFEPYWVSANSLITKHRPIPNRLNAMDTLGRKGFGVSRAALSSMIKGISRQRGVRLVDLSELEIPLPLASVTTFRESFPIDRNFFPPSVEQKGRSLIPYYLLISPALAATRLEQNGGRDTSLDEYLNQVLLWLAECNGAIEFAPKAVVSNRGYYAAGYPGGTIAIGFDLLQDLSDEAEVAAVLAHEMTHCVLQHGESSLQKKVVNLGIEESFAELTDEFNETDSITSELNDIIDETSALVSRRASMHEELEADSLTVIWLVKSGYDAGALARVISKIIEASSFRQSQEDGEANWIMDKVEYRKRLTAIESQMIHLPIPAVDGLRMEARYRSAMTDCKRRSKSAAGGRD